MFINGLSLMILWVCVVALVVGIPMMVGDMVDFYMTYTRQRYYAARHRYQVRMEEQERAKRAKKRKRWPS